MRVRVWLTPQGLSVPLHRVAYDLPAVTLATVIADQGVPSSASPGGIVQDAACHMQHVDRYGSGLSWLCCGGRAQWSLPDQTRCVFEHLCLVRLAEAEQYLSGMVHQAIGQVCATLCAATDSA